MAENAPEGPGAEPVWVLDERGYGLALVGGKLVCKNPAGKRLASVPSAVKDGAVAEQLLSLAEWLGEHEREARDTVESWMLRSLPVPRRVVEAVWADPAWRDSLENAVVRPLDADGAGADGSTGFLRGVDPRKGVGLVNLDGETAWIDRPMLMIPHPILVPELQDLRALATELAIQPRLAQLFRETWPKPAKLDPERTTIDEFAGGDFKQLLHALGRCRSLGYRTSGGFATTRVVEGGRVVEARFWVGSESPEVETTTGDLLWVDSREKTLKVGEIGPVAFSEGMRMASSVYAGRVVPAEAPTT